MIVFKTRGKLWAAVFHQDRGEGHGRVYEAVVARR